MNRFILVALFLVPQISFGFAEDLCFKNGGGFVNCLSYPKDPTDRSDNASFYSTIYSLWTRFSGPKVMNRLLDGRSMVHFDATFYMAQFVGLSYKQAHQIAAYDEAADRDRYIPYDQNGNPLIKNIEVCDNASLDRPQECDYVSKSVTGVTRYDFEALGGLLHQIVPMHLEFVKLRGLNPPLGSPDEVMLQNLQAWIYENKPLCAGGLIRFDGTCFGDSDQIRVYGGISLTKRSSFRINVDRNAGEQIISYQDGKRTHPIYSSQLHLLVGEDRQHIESLKMGIYLHALTDRVSHHQCGDKSRIDFSPDFGFLITLDPENCAIFGLHMLRHSLEVGMSQSQVPVEDQTLRPALDASYRALELFAKSKGLAPKDAKIRPTDFLEAIQRVLEIRDPSLRVNALTHEMLRFKLQPLPGHGAL